MKKLVLALVAALGLSIPYNVNAQDLMSPSEFDARYGAPVQARSVPQPVQETVRWTYDPHVRFTYEECRTYAGQWGVADDGRREVCRFPVDEHGQMWTPWSRAVQVQPVAQYAAGSIPQGLPPQMCTFIVNARGCRSGARWYVEVTAEYGPQSTLVLLDQIEEQYRGCTGLREPERARERQRINSEHGFNYRGGGVFHRYRNRYDAEPETDDERRYRIALDQYTQASGVCEAYLAWYQRTSGGSSIFLQQ